MPVARKPMKRLTVLDAVPDPIDTSLYPESLEGAAMEEVRQVRAALTAARKKEVARFDLVYDVGYFFVVVFEGSNQADAFLKATGAKLDGRTFVDGRVLAAHMGIDLPKVEGMPYDLGRSTLGNLVRRPNRGKGQR